MWDALEAINLANGPEVAKLMQEGAKGLINKGSPNEIILHVYMSALSRPPSRQEHNAAIRIVGQEPTQEGLEDLLWSVFMLHEFLYVN